MHGRRMIVLADAHVHVHEGVEPGALLDAAHRNLAAHAPAGEWLAWGGALLLAETARRRWFEDVQRANGARCGAWTVERGGDELTLRASRGADELAIVAGRQVVTAERVEVLALFTRECVPDGLPLVATLDAAVLAGAVAVLPWGVGKWMGRRGRLVEEALGEAGARPVYPGDIAARPRAWPDPGAFSNARRHARPPLPGTDPLPLPGDERRVGRYGFRVEARAATGRALRELLRAQEPPALAGFGARDRAWRVLRDQVRLRTAAGRIA